MTTQMEPNQIFQAKMVTGYRRSDGCTLPQLLRRNAMEFSDNVAIKSKKYGVWRPLTWSQLYKKVCHTARGLSAAGLSPGEVIAHISENREESWITEMAAISIGAISVSVFPDATAGEAEYILKHSNAVVAIAEDQEQVDKILEGDGASGIRRIVYIDERGLWHYEDTRLLHFDTLLEEGHHHESDAWVEDQIEGAAQQDVAVYCYTSGTTGKPKAAMLSHSFILDNAYRLMGGLQIEPFGNYLSYISPAWAAEQFMGVALPMLAPLQLHFSEKPETVQSDLREIGPEFLMFTPRQWEMQASDVEARMMDAPRWQQKLYKWGLQKGHERRAGQGGVVSRLLIWPLADQLVLKGVRDFLGLSQARAVLSGGSGLSAELFERYHAFGVPLGNLYGSSELGLISTHGTDRSSPASMGQLMPSDPDIGKPMEAWVDENGEFRLRVTAFSGYLENPEASKEMGDLSTGFHTGDAVKIDKDGELIFLDRVKDLRRLRNGQIYPPQFLENHLRADPLVRDAIVIGDESNDSVVALINIDPEIAGRFAERAGLAYGTFPELSQLAPVREEISQAVMSVNQMVDSQARITAFANLPKELDADEEELTRSRKLRRGAIHEKYADLIGGLYAGDETVQSEIEITYQDGSKSRLKAEVWMNPVETQK